MGRLPRIIVKRSLPDSWELEPGGVKGGFSGGIFYFEIIFHNKKHNHHHKIQGAFSRQKT